MQALIGQPVLTPEELSEIDRFLLDLLQEGRVTPLYAKEQVIEEGFRETITREYCQQQLSRFVEHGHARKLARGLYEVNSDPREEVV